MNLQQAFDKLEKHANFLKEANVRLTLSHVKVEARLEACIGVLQQIADGNKEPKELAERFIKAISK